MKKSLKTMLGVTLLEIMLVLAIAGIVIAMSVRYYTQASTNQKITAAISGITAMVSAVEQWRLQGKDLSTLTNANVSAYFTADSIPKSPWTGDAMTVAGSTNGTYTVSTNTSDIGSCNLLADQMSTQPGYSGACVASGFVVNVTVNTIPGGGAAT